MRIAQVGSSFSRICSNTSIPSWWFFSPWFALPARGRLGAARDSTQVLMFRNSGRKLFPFGCLPPWGWDRIAQHPGDIPLPPISLIPSSPSADVLITSHPQNTYFPPLVPPISACWSAALQLCSGHEKPQTCEACWVCLLLSLLANQSCPGPCCSGVVPAHCNLLHI